jgi:hypothetical protein
MAGVGVDVVVAGGRPITDGCAFMLLPLLLPFRAAGLVRLHGVGFCRLLPTSAWTMHSRLGASKTPLLKRLPYRELGGDGLGVQQAGRAFPRSYARLERGSTRL